MSALTDRIAAEHGGWFILDGVWRCNCGEPLPSSANADMWMRAHIATVTEAAVREQVAREIEDRFAPVLAVAGVVRVAIRLCIAIVRGVPVKDLPEGALS